MYLTTISSWALIISKAIDKCGIDSHEVFKLAGLDPDMLNDPNARYTYDGMTNLWRLAAEKTGDECIGLKAAHYWHPTTLHALGYAWMASETLKEALERVIRYLHVVTTAADLKLEESDAEIRLVFPVVTEPFPPAQEAVDAALAVIVDMCRTSFGDSFKPLHVYMSRQQPVCEKEISDFFAAPVSYGSAENIICFSREDLEKHLPTANAELARVNDNIVTQYLADLDKHDIKAQIEVKIIEQLPSGHITEEWMAQSLNKSLRSLQRKLSEKDTSYKQLLESTREKLAKQYILNSRYSINEITYLLGFSEPSNFSRAFKRWTGQSPSDFRKRH